MDKSERFYERIVLILMIGLFTFLMHTAWTAKGSHMVTTDGSVATMDFPKWIFGALLFFLCARLVDNILWWAKHRATTDTAQKVDLRIYLTMGFVVVYTVLWNVIGFCLSTFVFIVLEVQMLRPSNSWWKAILTSFLITATVYLVFGVLFKVYLPEPLLALIEG